MKSSMGGSQSQVTARASCPSGEADTPASRFKLSKLSEIVPITILRLRSEYEFCRSSIISTEFRKDNVAPAPTHERASTIWSGTAALASLIAGLLLTYQLGLGDPRLMKVLRASPEMMQILRDEHRLIANMVELQIANEKMLTPRRVPIPPRTQRRHPPFPRRHQCKAKASRIPRTAIIASNQQRISLARIAL